VQRSEVFADTVPDAGGTHATVQAVLAGGTRGTRNSRSCFGIFGSFLCIFDSLAKAKEYDEDSQK
jgi:hypothetical protein